MNKKLPWNAHFNIREGGGIRNVISKTFGYILNGWSQIAVQNQQKRTTLEQLPLTIFQCLYCWLWENTCLLGSFMIKERSHIPVPICQHHHDIERRKKEREVEKRVIISCLLFFVIINFLTFILNFLGKKIMLLNTLAVLISCFPDFTPPVCPPFPNLGFPIISMPITSTHQRHYQLHH